VTATTGLILGVLDTVLVGRAEDYARGERSAIGKRPVNGPVTVGPVGVVGDEQGDPVFHGGPDKAVHHYARDHYACWQRDLGALPLLDEPGAFGENLSSNGITEADVCIGDRIRVGTAVLRVSQGRRPCWKLNVRFGVPDMARRVLRTGRTGWYYAVEQPGTLCAGDEFLVLDRPYPKWPMSRLLHLVLHRGGSAAEVADAVRLPLPDSWRETLERRLRTGSAADEDWME
jgi:MOSC domain-containing protein YiiM